MSVTTFRSPRQQAARRSLKVKRSSYRAARAFYLTLLIGIVFAAWAFLDWSGERRIQHVIRRRDAIGIFQNAEEECRMVHNAKPKDQCAYIKEHCPDEESGFAAYLDMFYCSMSHFKPVAFIILISWLGLLFSTIGIAASDFFCINLSTIATILGMSESMAGVTLLAFGNGSPDVFSTFAAMSTNSGSLAVGELFGAAGFITAVVAGSMALIRPFHVAKKSFVRDVGFFVVAAAFSIMFLWDGKLHFWECVAMVLYYIFYVAFVVAWHWWLGRRRRRRERDAAARGHFLGPSDELDMEQEEYRDDPDDAPSRPTVARNVSHEDWAALERNMGDSWREEADEDDPDYEDLEEVARERWMSELSSNMRITRPPRSRKNTMNPVRPSLVGALEFQAVFKSLQKSRNHQTIPLHSRRYSDDPTYTTAQRQDGMSTEDDPAARPPFQVTVNEGESPAVERTSLDIAPNRTRAASANGAADLRINPNFQSRKLSPTHEDLIDVHDHATDASRRSSLLEVPGSGVSSMAVSPSSPLSPRIPPSRSSTGQSYASTASQSSDFAYAQPQARSTPSNQDHSAPKPIRRTGTGGSSKGSPQIVPSAKSLPRISIPRQTSSHASTPNGSPFPRYRDAMSPLHSRPSSIRLPPASIASPESPPAHMAVEDEVSTRPWRGWPYSIFPPPDVMFSILFPTICHWHDKTWWEKMLGVVAAPSVFLLTITLPVMESGKDGDDSDEEQEGTYESYDSNRRRSKSIGGLLDHGMAGVTGHGGSAAAAAHTEHQRHNYGSVTSPSATITIDGPDGNLLASPIEMEHPSPQPELWNRWLTITQLFTAPVFVILSIWNQSPIAMDALWLLKPILISLLISTVLLIPLLATTTPTHRPAIYRILLSSAGFVVSIAWISAIASEVVGALKALAVILNMSHAIMGLTIFAVGNSLGDLVADATVARLGYPVMALSACLGGPMLNILLGIGLSGSYIMLRGANHRHHKHPDKGLKFKTYEIDVSPSLIVSGATLLVTLLGLLVFVPLNKWVLSKRIGWALIALWTVSTIGNVVMEVTGWLEKDSQ